MKSDGTGQRRLAAQPPRPGSTVQSSPAWSPDGNLIAYLAGNAVHVIRPDGTGHRRLDPLASRVSNEGFAWAPDGTRLVAVTIDAAQTRALTCFR
jgi:dipeptidyl-peptidase 4